MSVDYAGAAFHSCGNDLSRSDWGNCKLAAAFPKCSDQLPKIVPTRRGGSDKAIYFDSTNNRFDIHPPEQGVQLGFMDMARYRGARNCLAHYLLPPPPPAESGLGLLDASPELRDFLLSGIHVVDMAAMLLIITPGGAIRYGAKRLFPRLAASAISIVERHAVLRAAAAATQAPAWAKAAAVMVTHAIRDLETVQNFSIRETLQDWYGGEKAWVTVPATAAIIGAGYYVARLPGGEEGLKAMFSVLLGVHGAERASLSRQKDGLSPRDIEYAAINRALQKNAGLSVAIMGFSGGAAALGGNWGQILCLVDDVMPGIAAALK